ncbi:glutathione synthetase ATP-binding domain-like protein [Nemania serpens]|nr:glutathione synthetase ATP-binding domain-like protein [Nemania serpens]
MSLRTNPPKLAMEKSYACNLTIDTDNDGTIIPLEWKVNPPSHLHHCWTLDMLLNGQPVSGANDAEYATRGCSETSGDRFGVVSLDSSSPWGRYVVEILQDLDQPGGLNASVVVKFIMSQLSGFCVRSDFLRRRLEGYVGIHDARSFLRPRQEIRCAPFPDETHLGASSLPRFLCNAIGAILVRSIDHLGPLETELVNRLSFPWVSPHCPPLKRIVFVKGRYNMDHSKRIWEAASALGMAVVVIDVEGHWLQDPQWSHIREGFISTNIDYDEGFADRLVAAVRGYGKPIHGITTTSTKRRVGVARACEVLGLPNSTSAAFLIAEDKFKSRQIEPDGGVDALWMSSAEYLENVLASPNPPHIQYPVVVKPCIGWCSECVSKVHSKQELMQAATRASERHRTSPMQRTDLMIEPYIEGPEIDANVVLAAGEIIFFEVADDFPSLADDKHNKWDDPFQETWMVFPSRLPHNEVEEIKRSLCQTLVRQGFRDGVFNCEGRVRYSNMHYASHDGQYDLTENEAHEASNKRPSFYLHEINARPPGYYGNVASNMTYGVDYYALDMLCAVGDMQRFRSLAHPFRQGPQWWLVITMIPEEREGVMKTEDACNEFLRKFRDLAAVVPDYTTFKKGGSRLEGPGASKLGFVAYLSVVSRHSRTDALQLAARIRREFTYELV